MRVKRSHVLDVALSYLGLQTDSCHSLAHRAFPFAFWLFKELLVWSNQSPVDGVGSLLSIHKAWLIIILLLIESSKLASLATPDRRVLTSSLDALLGNRSSHKRLVCHGFHRLLVILHTFRVVEELRLAVKFLLGGQLVLRPDFRVVIGLQTMCIRRIIPCPLSSLLYDLH